MLSKKIKMIGLASIMSLGVLCGASFINNTKPLKFNAANNIHELKAVIDVANSTMKVYNSNQSRFNNDVDIGIDYQERPKVAETTFLFTSIFKDFKFQFQQITGVTLNVSGGGQNSSVNEWVLGAVGASSLTGNYDETTNTVTFGQDFSDYTNIDSMWVEQRRTRNHSKYDYFTVDTLTINFTCENR